MERKQLEIPDEYMMIRNITLLSCRILNVPQEIEVNTNSSYGESNNNRNQFRNSQGSEDNYAYGNSNPKTVDGYNPSPNRSGSGTNQGKRGSGTSARSSDPNGNSFGDWPEAEEVEDNGNDRNRINVAIDK